MSTIDRYIIAEISDKNFYQNYISPLRSEEYQLRKAARGILIKDNTIALLHVTKKNYHKLPGGGIENSETNEEAFKREILEETGCACIIDNEEGQNLVTLEYRDQFKQFQISYVFSAKVVGAPKALQFTEEESADGFELKWISFNEIDAIMQNDNTADYEGKFIQLRDRAIISYYKKLLK